MCLIVDDENIAPVAELSSYDGVRVLLCAPTHRPQNSGRNEPSFLYDFFTDPIVTLGFQRNGLPVFHHDVWLEFFEVLGWDSVKFFVQIALSSRLQTVPTGDAADAVTDGEVRHDYEEVRGKGRSADLLLV